MVKLLLWLCAVTGVALAAAFLPVLRTGAAFRRYGGALAVLAGLWLGCWLAGEAQWPPQRHWQWIPYAALAAGLTGTALVAKGIAGWERAAAFLGQAFLAAVLVVPQWPDLAPPRTFWIAVTTVMLSLAASPGLIAGFIGSPWRLMAWCAICGLGLAGLVAEAVSIKLALWPFLGGWCAGCACLGLVVLRRRSAGDEDLLARIAAGAVFPWSMAVGSGAVVAAVEPQEPLWLLLVVPVIPAAAVGAARALAKIRGQQRTTWLLELAIVIAALTAMATLAVFGRAGGSGY